MVNTVELEVRFSQINEGDAIFISDLQLKELLKLSEIVFEEDTLISGFIKILKLKSHYIFQEQTPNNEIIIRKFSDLTPAQKLVGDRLDIYEKMWNGCGCKIDYL